MHEMPTIPLPDEVLQGLESYRAGDEAARERGLEAARTWLRSMTGDWNNAYGALKECDLGFARAAFASCQNLELPGWLKFDFNNDDEEDGDGWLEFPEGFRVSGPLYIAGSNMASLPANLAVKGYLDLRDCPNLKSLPEGLVIEPNDHGSDGDLVIEWCEGWDERIPVDARIAGSIVVRDHSDRWSWTEFHDITLARWRWVERLREEVGLYLTAWRSGAALAPEGALFAATSGGLAKHRVSMDTLAILLRVFLDIDPAFGNAAVASLSGKELPAGNLVLSHCEGLACFPGDVAIKGDLDLSYCPALNSIGRDLLVTGSMNLCGCRALESLPEGLRVKRGLNLSMCKSLTALPEGIEVGKFFKPALQLAHCSRWDRKIPQSAELPQFFEDPSGRMRKTPRWWMP